MTFYYQGNQYLKFINHIHEKILISIMEFHIQKKKKNFSAHENVKCFGVMNDCSLPKILKEILFKILWPKIMHEIILCFEN